MFPFAATPPNGLNLLKTWGETPPRTTFPMRAPTDVPPNFASARYDVAGFYPIFLPCPSRTNPIIPARDALIARCSQQLT